MEYSFFFLSLRFYAENQFSNLKLCSMLKLAFEIGEKVLQVSVASIALYRNFTMILSDSICPTHHYHSCENHLIVARHLQLLSIRH